MVLDLGEHLEELVRRHHLAVVLDTELVGELGGVVGLVEVLVVKAHRERLIGHETRGDITGIHAAREERADLDVGDAVRGDALVDHLVAFLHVLVERLGIVVREIGIPVAAHVHARRGDVVGEAVRRRQLEDAGEEGLVGRGELHGEIRTQRLLVHGLLEMRMLEEALDLGAEHQVASSDW